MNKIAKYGILFKNDLRNIFRDKILLMLFLYPVVFIILFRWLADTFTTLTPYLPLLLAFAYIIMPNMMGAMLGFLILDEKDDKVIVALRIMPISATGFILYRMIFPIIFVFVVNLIMPLILDFVDLSGVTILFLAIISALEAPLLGLAISGKAANKVEGMAMFKFAGLAFMLPIASIMITSDWAWAFGVLPTFWPVRLVIDSVMGQPEAWIYVVGVLYNLLVLAAVGWYFKKSTLEATK